MTTRMQLSERSQLVAESRIDREAGVIRNVKVIGTSSKNRRSYPMEVLERARPLYEGAAVKIDHPAKGQTSRSVLETFGELRNVRVQASGPDPGLYADLPYNRQHAHAGYFLEQAERFPDKFGLSHNADGSGRETADGFLVESIHRVISVDLVDSPATNKSLFEEDQTMKLRSIKIRDLAGTLPLNSKERETLTRLMEEEGGMNGDTMVATSDAPSPEEAIKQAFRAQIVAIFDDTSKDLAGQMAAFKELLKKHDKVQTVMAGPKDKKPEGEGNSGAPAAEGSNPTKAQEGSTTEVGKLLEKLERLEARDQVRELLRECKREVSAEQFDALVATPAAHRKVMIEAMGQPLQESRGNKPRTVGTSQATGGSNTQKPEYGSGDKFMEHLRGAELGNLFESVN